MAEFTGNLMPAPGFNQNNWLTYDYEIMSDMAGYNQIGVTLAANQGILPAGTVLGRVTATKKYKVYNNGASDGTEVARGVLRKAVDTTGAEYQANIVVKGTIKNDRVSGADSAAITDLGARVDTVLNTFTIQ